MQHSNTSATATPFSEMTAEERYAYNIDRARNFPMFADGVTTPIAVGYISHYTATNGTERVIINLACKTERSVGGTRAQEHRRPEANATISQPAEWKLKFQTGDYVCAVIEDGYVKKLLPATAMAARQINYRAGLVAETEAAMLARNKEQVDPETGEVTPKADAAYSGNDEDLPF